MQRRPEAFDSQLRTDADGHVVNVGADPRDRYKRIFGDTSVTCGDDLSEVLEQALGERLSSAEADKTFEILAWHPGSGSPSDRRQRTISGCLDNQVDRLVFVSDDTPADGRGVPVEQIASFEIHKRRIRGGRVGVYRLGSDVGGILPHRDATSGAVVDSSPPLSADIERHVTRIPQTVRVDRMAELEAPRFSQR